MCLCLFVCLLACLFVCKCSYLVHHCHYYDHVNHDYDKHYYCVTVLLLSCSNLCIVLCLVLLVLLLCCLPSVVTVHYRCVYQFLSEDPDGFSFFREVEIVKTDCMLANNK